MSEKVTIEIPTPMRPQVGDNATVDVAGETVKAILDDLVSQFPDVKGRLFEDGGELRRFINIYVDDEDIRFLDNLDTPVTAKTEVAIVPAIAGGLS